MPSKCGARSPPALRSEVDTLNPMCPRNLPCILGNVPSSHFARLWPGLCLAPRVGRAGWLGDGEARHTHTHNSETPSLLPERVWELGPHFPRLEGEELSWAKGLSCPSHPQGPGCGEGLAQVPARPAPLPGFNMLSWTARAWVQDALSDWSMPCPPNGCSPVCTHPRALDLRVCPDTLLPHSQHGRAPHDPVYLSQDGSPVGGWAAPTCSKDGQREVGDGFPGVGLALGPALPRPQDGQGPSMAVAP